MEIKFGPAGNSDSFAKAGFKSTVDAPKWLHDMGLNAYEYQCGRGVNIGEETAKKIGEQAKIYNISLSLHTPYYINLSSAEPERLEKNVDYIIKSCIAATNMGATRLVVHTGGLGKQTRIKAMENSVINIKNILNAIEEHGFKQTICLETMGKKNVIGSAEEICELVALDDRLLPCIDFGHLNSRTGGKCNSYEDFNALFNLFEDKIGKERTKIFHAHFSKIEYSDKGEVRHLTFDDKIYGPEFEPLAKVLVERNYTPTIICESAGTQAEDAKTMQTLYQEAKNLANKNAL